MQSRGAVTAGVVGVQTPVTPKKIKLGVSDTAKKVKGEHQTY